MMFCTYSNPFRCQEQQSARLVICKTRFVKVLSLERLVFFFLYAGNLHKTPLFVFSVKSKCFLHNYQRMVTLGKKNTHTQNKNRTKKKIKTNLNDHTEEEKKKKKGNVSFTFKRFIFKTVLRVVLLDRVA